jgi:hypothetical protein
MKKKVLIMKKITEAANLSAINKQKLRQMAKSGEARPGMCLCDAIYKSLMKTLKVDLPTAKNLVLNLTGRPYDSKFDADIRSLRPHWFKKPKSSINYGDRALRAAARLADRRQSKKSITCKEVVDKLVWAVYRADKAHATRKLNAYVAQQCAVTGAKPTQIIAGVKAAVTKRKQSL